MRAYCLAAALLAAPLPPAAAQTQAQEPEAQEAPATSIYLDRSDLPYNTLKTPLGDHDLILLTQNGYRVQADGAVLAPGSRRPVGRSEMGSVLEELTGRQKLKAMLELDALFNRYGTKKLPEEGAAELRRIARQNWPLLSPRLRGDLKGYFSGYELEALNKGVRPVRVPQTWLLQDTPSIPGMEQVQVPPGVPAIEPESPPLQAPAPVAWAQAPGTWPLAASAATIPPPAAAQAAPAPQAAASVRPAEALARSLEAAELERLKALAARTGAKLPQPQPAPAPGSPVPVSASAASTAPFTAELPDEAPKLAAAPQQIPQQTATIPAAPASDMSAGTGRVETGPRPPAPASTQPILASAIPAALPQAAPPAPQPPPSIHYSVTDAGVAPVAGGQEAAPSAPAQPGVAGTAAAAPTQPAAAPAQYPEVSQQEFDRFLTEIPYGRDVKPLLKLLSEHADPGARRVALGATFKFLPQIVVDARRAGSQARAANRKLQEDDPQSVQALIALHPGPALATRKRLLLGSEDFLVPDAPSYYQERGVPPPDLQALTPGASPEQEYDAELGRLREYADGSRRLRHSAEQLAGQMLRQLLLLDGRMRGFDSDAYHQELRARAAEFRLLRRLRQATGSEPALDRDLQAEYAEWLERPLDHQDLVLQGMSAPAAAAAAPSLSGKAPQRAEATRRHDLALLRDAGLAPAPEGGSPRQLAEETVVGDAELDEAAAEELRTLGSATPAARAWVAEERKFRAEPGGR